MFAIAAMARHSRVIGHAGRTPWHLPAELRWFRETTIGGVVLMGRKTFDSIGRPLPDRLNLVATGRPLSGNGSDVQTVSDLAAFRPEDYAPRPVWVIGGAEIFAQTLALCEAVYLSFVDLEVNGDTFFPAFEQDFPHAETIRREPGFEVVRFLRTKPDAFRLKAPW